jgi:hypothetical protein
VKAGRSGPLLLRPPCAFLTEKKVIMLFVDDKTWPERTGPDLRLQVVGKWSGISKVPCRGGEVPGSIRSIPTPGRDRGSRLATGFDFRCRPTLAQFVAGCCTACAATCQPCAGRGTEVINSNQVNSGKATVCCPCRLVCSGVQCVVCPFFSDGARSGHGCVCYD